MAFSKKDPTADNAIQIMKAKQEHQLAWEAWKRTVGMVKILDPLTHSLREDTDIIRLCAARERLQELGINPDNKEELKS